VAGPPTGVPTVNLIALGLGVGSSLITGQFLSADRASGELVQPASMSGLPSTSAFAK
jgi:hypothetical protein